MRKVIVLLVVTVVGIGLPTAAAEATTSTVSIISCGQVVTTDAVLRTDLVCAGDGVVIGGNDLTVRLAGHSITSSDGTGVGISFGGSGASEKCWNNVAIRGGTVSGFFGGVGMSCQEGTEDSVSGMQLTDNTWGLSVYGQTTLDVDHTTIVGPNGVGPRICCGGQQPGVHMTHSMIDVTSSTGVAWFTAQDSISTIDSSRIEGGLIEPAVNSDLTISNSHLTDDTVWCSDAGITVSGSDLVSSPVTSPEACGQTFSDDRFVGPGSGVGLVLDSFFEGDSPSVTHSVFTGWDTAVMVDLGPGSLITDNTFRDNGTGVTGCTQTSCTPGATVTGNRFVDNAGTGLLATYGTWTIGSNTALRNGGLGIDAEGPELTVIDLGGNIARHNQPPQCIGVVCTP